MAKKRPFGRRVQPWGGQDGEQSVGARRSRKRAFPLSEGQAQLFIPLPTTRAEDSCCAEIGQPDISQSQLPSAETKIPHPERVGAGDED
jgi:hypothetical protein